MLSHATFTAAALIDGLSKQIMRHSRDQAKALLLPIIQFANEFQMMKYCFGSVWE